MSGRRRVEQHCHMQYEKRQDEAVRLSVQKTSSVPSQRSTPMFGGVGSRPSAACEEDSHHANPIYRHRDPERAEHQSVALA